MSDAILQDARVFPYQSYFDAVLLEAAVLAQGTGQLLVDSAAVPARDSNTRGFGLGLDPSSETPIAVSFKRYSGSASGAMLLRPGQIVFPFGREEAFAGFRWGLPFGWLGGGLAGLTVIQNAKAELAWSAVSPSS